jgi:hypothetical protein
MDERRQGRVQYLEAVVIASLGKISTAMKVFRDWAQARGLEPSETASVARTRDRPPLRFSKSGDPAIERAYRTHWVSPEVSERRREQLAERQSRPPDLVVVSPAKDWTCALCGSADGGWLIMEEDGPSDVELPARMALAIRKVFPACAAERAEAIARHAAQRGSVRWDAPPRVANWTGMRLSRRHWRQSATKTPN